MKSDGGGGQGEMVYLASVSNIMMLKWLWTVRRRRTTTTAITCVLKQHLCYAGLPSRFGLVFGFSAWIPSVIWAWKITNNYCHYY